MRLIYPTPKVQKNYSRQDIKTGGSLIFIKAREVKKIGSCLKSKGFNAKKPSWVPCYKTRRDWVWTQIMAIRWPLKSLLALFSCKKLYKSSLRLNFMSIWWPLLKGEYPEVKISNSKYANQFFFIRKTKYPDFWRCKAQNCRKHVSLCKNNEPKWFLGLFQFLANIVNSCFFHYCGPL